MKKILKMQVIYLVFLTFFSCDCGFAQKGLSDSEDINLLVVDAEENPAALNPKDDECNCANLADIQRELSVERAKNRDLNQTISDILEEMEDMKENIMRNEEKIIDNKSSVVLLTKDVEDLQDEVIIVAEDVESLTSSDQQQTSQIASLTSSDQQQTFQISSLATRGTWCGYQNYWNTVGTITYDSLTFSNSNNMDLNGTPLNMNTGKF